MPGPLTNVFEVLYHNISHRINTNHHLSYFPKEISTFTESNRNRNKLYEHFYQATDSEAL